jgi:hypothetical protein
VPGPAQCSSVTRQTGVAGQAGRPGVRGHVATGPRPQIAARVRQSLQRDAQPAAGAPSAPHQPLVGSPLSAGEREVAELLLLRGKVFHFPEKGKESLTGGHTRV